MYDLLLKSIMKYPRLTGWVGIICSAILLSVLWWLLFWQTPQAVFNGMLSNNLAATSVTKFVNASTSTQGVAQTIRLQMGSTNAAEWLVTAKQSDSSATTESIGTPNGGFVRYVQITPTKQDVARKLNFSNVVNVWGKSDASDTSLNHLFDQTVLDISNAPVPPIGNLSADKRQSLLDFMKQEHVYTPAYSQTKQQRLGGRQLDVFTVSVGLGSYVRMMQMFAHDEGFTSLDSVDPGQYASLPPVQIELAVDKASHQLVGVTYPANSFAQRYSDWGVMTPVQLPTKTIPISVLQSRIQSASGS